ncbi:unnamed protein product, partial [Symbiodinium sp. KB8]
SLLPGQLPHAAVEPQEAPQGKAKAKAKGRRCKDNFVDYIGGVKDDGDAQQQSALEAMAQHVVDGAPASSFGRLARGFRADSEASKASVVGASKVSEDNAERDSKASLYRRDQFHTLKYGFLKDCGASIIIWLCDLAYFDEACAQESLSIDSRLDRAYGLFKLWTIVAKKSTTLRKFTRGTFHRVTTKKFPYLSGKGADVVVVLSWLVWLLQLKLGAPK